MSQESRITGVLRQSDFPDELVADILNRDAAIWIGSDVVQDPEQAHAVAMLMALPWVLVLCEDPSAALAKELDRLKGEASVFTSQRGYIDIVTRDPANIQLPPRALPVYLLNGREDTVVREESNQLGATAAMRRRLNMTKRLIDARPRLLVTVSSGQASTLGAIRDLWDEGFNSLLTYVTPNENEAAQVEEWQASALGPAAVLLVTTPLQPFAEQCVRSVEAEVPEGRVVIRYRTAMGTTCNLDVTACEKPEFPILDHYDLIQANDLNKLLPEELTEEDLNLFFSKAPCSWRPYAAGLPWSRDTDASNRLMEALATIASEGCNANKLLLVQAEPGAGGTVFAKALAFQAASLGYPTFVAKPSRFLPVSTEITTFLFQVRQRFLQEAADVRAESVKDGQEEKPGDVLGGQETPALLVFDVQHWVGKEALLPRFVRDLVRESRPAVVLSVVEKAIPDELGIGRVISAPISHQMAREEVESFGTHINRFLAPKGRDRSIEDWLGFWSANSPPIGDFGSTPASFWVALEFWLRFQIDMHESIQGWLYQHYKAAQLTPQLKLAILEIAAMSIERHALPERLLPSAPPGEFPYSVQLEGARQDVPSLGIVRTITTTGRHWTIAHSLLGRYLVQSVLSDRKEMASLGLPNVPDPVTFRLELLRRVITQPEVGTAPFVPLAAEFAQTILKLDRDGNREFFSHWRTVLDILESVPDRVWDTSRAFNHHVAISRRRLVTDQPMFPLTLEERLQQIELSIEHMTYALEQLAPDVDGERNLNILNSLARAYQDRAGLAEEQGDPPEQVTEYRIKATDLIRRAQQEEPNNAYVLETLARDLIQTAKGERPTRVRCVCEALMCINSAMGLDSAIYRRERLSKLIETAMSLITGEGVPGEIVIMRKNRQPVGCVAAAWIELYKGQDWRNGIELLKVPRGQVEMAIHILGEIPPVSHSPLDLKLKYDLICVAEPCGFTQQLEVLDELHAGTLYRPDIQQRVDYAVLLYQVGRYIEGSQRFREIRREIAETQAFIVIPKRLRVLLNRDTGKAMICSVVVKESGSFRGRAYIQDFGKDWVPFIPRDWGKTGSEMPAGFSFTCQIVFGPNGPFVRPVPGGA